MQFCSNGLYVVITLMYYLLFPVHLVHRRTPRHRGESSTGTDCGRLGSGCRCHSQCDCRRDMLSDHEIKNKVNYVINQILNRLPVYWYTAAATVIVSTLACRIYKINSAFRRNLVDNFPKNSGGISTPLL